jgi:nucleotide-binding universal stress UspA family protein
MYEINRILICLDLTRMDEALMKYTEMLARYMKIRKIYLLHVTKSLDLDSEIKKKYPDLFAPLDESIRQDIQKRAEEIYQDEGVEIEVEVLEGDPFERVLRWSKVKDIDLIVMGRKKQLSGSGFLPEKMANILLCSVLFVPENVIAKMERILVPFDFSEFSDNALGEALFIKDHYGAEVICQHVYEVPQGYTSTGKSFEEFAEIMKDNAVQNFKQHITDLENVSLDDVEVVYTLREGKDLSSHVYEHAIDSNVDMIIAGSRGRTKVASILLGSVAGKLIRNNSDIPLMIVKDKKGNMGFFDALLNI